MSEIATVPVSKISSNPYQPRKTFDAGELSLLSDSIRELGILQPLLVRRIGGGYELIAGERRLRAARQAGLEEVPALVLDAVPEASALMALVENLQRTDLTYWEEAEGFRRLMRDFNLTQEGIAQRVGKSQSAVANKLRLLRLEPEVRAVLEAEGLTERHARALLSLSAKEERMKAVLEMAGRRLSVRESEQLVEKAQPTGGRKAVRGAIRDVRIVVNSLKRALEPLSRHGIEAELDESEHEEYWEFRVRIPKR